MIRTAWIYFNAAKDECEARLGRKKLMMYIVGTYVVKTAIIGLGLAYIAI